MKPEVTKTYYVDPKKKLSNKKGQKKKSKEMEEFEKKPFNMSELKNLTDRIMQVNVNVQGDSGNNSATFKQRKHPVEIPVSLLDYKSEKERK